LNQSSSHVLARPRFNTVVAIDDRARDDDDVTTVDADDAIDDVRRLSRDGYRRLCAV